MASGSVRAHSPRVKSGTSMLWLRLATDHSLSGAITDHDARFPDCAAVWSLVTAVTGRRVLAEVPDFTRSVWPEIDERAEASIAFVDAPSSATAAKLSTASVKWVYVDKAVTDARSWEPWARIEYENDLAAVLRLLP